MVKPSAHGIWVVRLSKWRYFHDFVHQQMLDFTNHVWRGQRCDDHELESSLDRELRGKGPHVRKRVIAEHMESFKYAVRGRRGPNPIPLLDENEWWALGQHHGLITPLLDWTTSPFVALYFAFEKKKVPQTRYRAVFALSRDSVEKISAEIRGKHRGLDRPRIVEFIRPLTDDNPRLVNQGGLFSRAPDASTIEDWMRENVSEDITGGMYIKLLIPDSDRLECLRTLNRMNINHLTLFPDLYGASAFCNTALGIEKY